MLMQTLRNNDLKDYFWELSGQSETNNWDEWHYQAQWWGMVHSKLHKDIIVDRLYGQTGMIIILLWVASWGSMVETTVMAAHITHIPERLNKRERIVARHYMVLFHWGPVTIMRTEEKMMNGQPDELGIIWGAHWRQRLFFNSLDDDDLSTLLWTLKPQSRTG